MKHLAIFWVLVFFASCTLAPQTPQSSEDISIQSENTWSILQDDIQQEIPLETQTNASQQPTSLEDIFSYIQDLQENEVFVSCMMTSTDNCISVISAGATDVFDCDTFILEDNRNRCKNTQIIQTAKNQKDIELCNDIAGEEGEYCKFEVALEVGLEQGDTTLCESLEQSYQAQCNNNITLETAKRQKDTTICNNIVSLSWEESAQGEKEFCMAEVEFLIEEAANPPLPAQE